MKYPLKVLVVGCGTVGTSHALAYQAIDEFEIVCLVSQAAASRQAETVGQHRRSHPDRIPARSLSGNE